MRLLIIEVSFRILRDVSALFMSVATNASTIHHRLRIPILQILTFSKIRKFLRILKVKFIKFKLSHSSLPSSNKLFVPKVALNF